MHDREQLEIGSYTTCVMRYSNASKFQLLDATTQVK